MNDRGLYIEHIYMKRFIEKVYEFRDFFPRDSFIHALLFDPPMINCQVYMEAVNDNLDA